MDKKEEPNTSSQREWVVPELKRLEAGAAESQRGVTPDGGGVRNLTRTPALTESHPTWAPDGRLTFTRHAESGPVELWVISPDGGGAERLATTAEPVFTYDWQ